MPEMTNIQNWTSTHGHYRSHDRVLYDVQQDPRFFFNVYHDSPEMLFVSIKNKGNFHLHGDWEHQPRSVQLQDIERIYSRAVSYAPFEMGYDARRHFTDLPIEFHVELKGLSS